MEWSQFRETRADVATLSVNLENHSQMASKDINDRQIWKLGQCFDIIKPNNCSHRLQMQLP